MFTKHFNMKKHLIFIACLFLLIGCKKEINDEYYVKYIVNTSSLDEGGKIIVIFKNEDEKHISLTMEQGQGLTWETIIGPVTKGFNAEIKTHNKTAIKGLHVYSEIDISKNNSPFAYKISDDPQSDNSTALNTTLKYEIDY